jgi:hypothetical protein
VYIEPMHRPRKRGTAWVPVGGQLKPKTRGKGLKG